GVPYSPGSNTGAASTSTIAGRVQSGCFVPCFNRNKFAGGFAASLTFVAQPTSASPAGETASDTVTASAGRANQAREATSSWPAGIVDRAYTCDESPPQATSPIQRWPAE